MFSCPSRLRCGVMLLGQPGFGLGGAKPPAQVTVQHSETREIVDHSECNGWTDASKTVGIRSRVRGHIDQIHFTDGQIVDAGQLLFELDPRRFHAELAPDQLAESGNSAENL